MKELDAWFENPDYNTGVQLYKNMGGSDPVLLSIFSLSETSFTRGKLEEALRQHLPQVEPVKQEEEKPKTPPVVLALIRERSQLHEALFTCTSKTDRYKISTRILSIGKILDRYYDHGELPQDQAENEQPEADIPRNAWELHTLIGTNAAYITKNRNREDKQGEVKRRERQNEKIEARLKSMNYEQ
jgi:hypothetical protein